MQQLQPSSLCRPTTAQHSRTANLKAETSEYDRAAQLLGHVTGPSSNSNCVVLSFATAGGVRFGNLRAFPTEAGAHPAVGGLFESQRVGEGAVGGAHHDMDGRHRPREGKIVEDDLVFQVEPDVQAVPARWYASSIRKHNHSTICLCGTFQRAGLCVQRSSLTGMQL